MAQTRTRYALVAAFVIVLSAVATLVALASPLAGDMQVTLTDLTGQPVAQLGMEDGSIFINTSPILLFSPGTAHLWGFDADGVPVHITKLPKCNAALPSRLDQKRFAISLESPEFKGQGQPGLLLAASQARTFFSHALHPKFVCASSCCM